MKTHLISPKTIKEKKNREVTLNQGTAITSLKSFFLICVTVELVSRSVNTDLYTIEPVGSWSQDLNNSRYLSLSTPKSSTRGRI